MRRSYYEWILWSDGTEEDNSVDFTTDYEASQYAKSEFELFPQMKSIEIRRERITVERLMRDNPAPIESSK